jgi:zinc protease
MKRKTLMFVCFLLSVSLVINADMKKEDIKVFRLDNGLKVLLLEDHDIPNIAYYTFFKVGSRNERNGITGVSHFIEHMMFNGSAKVGPGEFDRIMEFMGGSNNAYTSREMTAYTNWFPSSVLEEMIKIEADRMQDAMFDPTVLESERGVIAEERRVSTDNDNDALLDEQVVATAITAHPYHWDVIGWMSDIQSWKRDDILNYYHTYYAPNNAVIVIAGDFETDNVIELVKKYYDHITPGTPPPPVATVEPEQMGTKRVQIIKEAQAPSFIMVYHAPKFGDPDYYPMSIIETVLLGGESGRLYKRLVREEQIALEVGGGIDQNIDPFLFYFRIQPKVDADLGKIEKIIIEELEKIKKDGITERELRKAVNNVKSGLYRPLQTIAGKANLLGNAELLAGDYSALFTWIDTYQKVSIKNVQDSAAKYFSDKNKTVGTLIPEGGAK